LLAGNLMSPPMSIVYRHSLSVVLSLCVHLLFKMTVLAACV
jgi:hypothetical protein